MDERLISVTNFVLDSITRKVHTRKKIKTLSLRRLECVCESRARWLSSMTRLVFFSTNFIQQNFFFHSTRKRANDDDKQTTENIMFRKKKFRLWSRKVPATCDEDRFPLSPTEFEWHVEMISWQKSAKKLILNFHLVIMKLTRDCAESLDRADNNSSVVVLRDLLRND